MDNNPIINVSYMTLQSQEVNAEYTLNRLLDPRLPSYAFAHSLQSFLASSARGLAWQAANPTVLEPFTFFARKSLYMRIDTAVSRYEEATRSLTVIQALSTTLRNFRVRTGSWVNITAEAVMAVLGGEDRFNNFMDAEILAKVVGMKDKARTTKTALQRRIWAIDAHVEMEHMVWPEIKGLLIKYLTGEVGWHCECETLFSIEQDNREMVQAWFGR